MTQNDFSAPAEERSRFFWWLSEWFISPPDQEKLASLPQAGTASRSEVADALDAAWQALGVATQGTDTTAREGLGTEFTRLMSGVQEGMGPPPPFESVWREDRLIGESTLAVIDAYNQAGFADIAPEAGPQDHIGVELKFMAILALREAEAWGSGNGETAQIRVVQQAAFLQQHLGAWAPRWADAIIQQAREPLYTALAGLLKASLTETQSELSSLLKQAA